MLRQRRCDDVSKLNCYKHLRTTNVLPQHHFTDAHTCGWCSFSPWVPPAEPCNIHMGLTSASVMAASPSRAEPHRLQSRNVSCPALILHTESEVKSNQCNMSDAPNPEVPLLLNPTLLFFHPSNRTGVEVHESLGSCYHSLLNLDADNPTENKIHLYNPHTHVWLIPEAEPPAFQITTE